MGSQLVEYVGAELLGQDVTCGRSPLLAAKCV